MERSQNPQNSHDYWTAQQESSFTSVDRTDFLAKYNLHIRGEGEGFSVYVIFPIENFPTIARASVYIHIFPKW